MVKFSSPLLFQSQAIQSQNRSQDSLDVHTCSWNVYTKKHSKKLKITKKQRCMWNIDCFSWVQQAPLFSDWKTGSYMWMFIILAQQMWVIVFSEPHMQHSTCSVWLFFFKTLSPTTVGGKQEKCSHLLYTHFYPIMSQTFPLCKNKYLLI